MDGEKGRKEGLERGKRGGEEKRRKKKFFFPESKSKSKPYLYIW